MYINQRLKINFLVLEIFFRRKIIKIAQDSARVYAMLRTLLRLTCFLPYLTCARAFFVQCIVSMLRIALLPSASTKYGDSQLL